MGLRDSSRHVPARVMSAAAATASSPRDNGTNSSTGPESAVNGSATDGQESRGSADVEASTGGGGAARVRRKRRHTCPDYRSSPPPLENGWHSPGKRLSPPPRLGSLDGATARTPAPGSRRSSEGDGWPGRAGLRHAHDHERPAKMPRLEICLKKIPGDVVAAKEEGEKMKNGNGADDEPPPPLDGADEVKEEPPDIVKASPPVSPEASAPSSPPPASPSSPPPASPAPSPPASPPALPQASSPPPPASPQASHPASPPPTPTSSRKRTNMTETEKLYLNSECHKTEILSTKLRHTACRKSGAATAAKSSTKGKMTTTKATAQPPVLMPNGGEPGGKRRKKGAPVPRRRRPPPPPKVESPATDSESDGPPHLEPEAPLAAAVAPRAGRGQRRGTPAPQLREAESEADSVSFSFQAAPETEEWFRTFYRQEEGRRAVEDFSWAPVGGGQRLPYQMSEEELFPRDLVPGGGRPRPLRPPTLPDRWLPPLPAAAGEEEKAATAPPEEWLCLEDLCAVLHRASAGCGRSPPGEFEPLDDEVAAVLTAWPANCSLRELATALSERSAELPGSEQPSPSDAGGGGADVSGCGSPADWSGADTGSEPSRPPSSADDASSVSTDASAGSGARRKPAKRRKNRTGWPRAKVRKSNLLKAAVSRAAAEARDAAGPS